MDIDHFKQHFQTQLGFRLVMDEDMMRLLNWRNADHVRPFMHQPDVIMEADHIQWFTRMMQSPTDLYFIYELNQQPVGLLCFNHIDDDHAEWGFYLGEQQLPKGTGTQMLTKGLTLAFVTIGLTTITATITGHNEKSRHLHQKLGFIERNGQYSISKETFDRIGS